VLGVALLQGGQYALFGAYKLLVEPFTIVKAGAWCAGLLPLVLLLAMLWSGNLFVRRALLLGHMAVVLTMMVGVVFLMLLPAALAGGERTKVWLLLAMGALSGLLCVLLVRPSARAFLEQQRTRRSTPPSPADQAPSAAP
jgi:hypothetical protein